MVRVLKNNRQVQGLKGLMRQKEETMHVVTRFAPSPTGYLHIGGARTALFNWLYARHTGGKFILRIEDTDRQRSTDASIEIILEAMKWLGLDWDEGPYFQTERMAIYRETAQKLLDTGWAYRCYCTPEELEEKRKKALREGRKPKYDGTCRYRTDFPKDKPYVLRFKCPQEGTVVVEDLVKGTVKFDVAELDDLIIIRSDGGPTYNFAVVVDDATMGITHVIRGDDHLNNTPRQILIYKALGYPLPKFAHVPMILGQDHKRLSKRHGSVSVLAYRDEGYLPQALTNYLVRLGWSHGDQEIFSTQELIKLFTLKGIGKSAGIFNPEKLLWLNGRYIRSLSVETLVKEVRPFIEADGLNPSKEKLFMAVRTLKERSRTLKEMTEGMRFYFTDRIDYDPKAAKKFLRPEVVPLFSQILTCLNSLDVLDKSNLEGCFRKVTEENQVKLGKVAQPVRVALTGRAVSPGLFEVMEVLGKEKTISRLRDALAYLTTKETAKS